MSTKVKEFAKDQLIWVMVLLWAILFGCKWADGGVVANPPLLQATMNDDGTISQPSPVGWKVIETERTANGIRYYAMVDGKLLWAEYSVPFQVTITGTGPNPPAPVTVPVVTVTTLPAATTNTPYIAAFTVSGGTGPYIWASPDTLPTGLSLQPIGLLSGMPTTAGTFTFKVVATDSKGQASVPTTITLVVNGVTPPNPPIPDPVEPTKVKVVLFYNPTGIGDLTPAQQKLVFDVSAGSLREYLTKTCPVDASGMPQFRVWPTTLSSGTVDAAWKALVDKAAGTQCLVVQGIDSGTITKLDFPKDAPSAISAMDLIANPKTGPPAEATINDENYKKFLDVPGMSTGYVKGSKPMSLPSYSSSFKLIPRSQWKQLVEEGKGTFLSDLSKAYKIKVKDQDGLNYCWAYASTSTVEVIRALQNQPYVNLSPESVGGPVKGWRNVGGWGYDALDQLSKAGACNVSFMDKANSLAPNRWKTGWQEDALNHKITDAWATLDDGGFDAVFTAALLRVPVSIGLDWWSHQVMVCDPVVFSNGTYGVMIRNSWGDRSDFPEGWGTLTESRSQPSGSFGCISVLTNDKQINDSQRGTEIDLVKLRQATVKKAIETTYQTAP